MKMKTTMRYHLTPVRMAVITVEDFNTPLTSIDRSSRQEINKETAALNDTLDQMDLIDIFKHFTPKQQNIPTFQVHMEHFLGETKLGHKTSLNTFKKISII